MDVTVVIQLNHVVPENLAIFHLYVIIFIEEVLIVLENLSRQIYCKV